MKEIKNVLKLEEKEAYENVKDFDFSSLCFKTVFDILNDNKILAKAFSETTTFDIRDKDQISLVTFRYGFVKERDEKVYPMVDLIIWLKDYDSEHGTYFCLTLTPFSASLNNITKDAGVYSGCDDKLTQAWKIMLKGFFKKKWVNAFKRYREDIKSLEESEIATKAEIEYQKIEQEHEREINSI